jgi:hypothetical protein
MTSNSPRSVETPLGVLLLLAALATAAVGLWLLWVCAMVLPSRDPAHLPMWRVVAVAFLAYAALSVASVAARLAWLRGSLLALSLGATALGACGIVAMLQQAGRGGHFEGYLVLMGLVLTGHGLFGTLFALRARTGTTPANA